MSSKTVHMYVMMKPQFLLMRPSMEFFPENIHREFSLCHSSSSPFHADHLFFTTKIMVINHQKIKLERPLDQ